MGNLHDICRRCDVTMIFQWELLEANFLRGILMACQPISCPERTKCQKHLYKNDMEYQLCNIGLENWPNHLWHEFGFWCEIWILWNGARWLCTVWADYEKQLGQKSETCDRLKSGKTQPTVAPKWGQTIMVSVLIMTIMTMMIAMIMMVMASVLSYGAAS